jgi:hypothetical protein
MTPIITKPSIYSWLGMPAKPATRFYVLSKSKDPLDEMLKNLLEGESYEPKRD